MILFSFMYFTLFSFHSSNVKQILNVAYPRISKSDFHSLTFKYSPTLLIYITSLHSTHSLFFLYLSGYYFSAAKPRFGQRGENAILHTPYYAVQSSSTLSIKFRFRIPGNDGTQLKLFLSQQGKRRTPVGSLRSRGRSWTEEYKTVTVARPFRVNNVYCLKITFCIKHNF